MVKKELTETQPLSLRKILSMKGKLGTALRILRGTSREAYVMGIFYINGWISEFGFTRIWEEHKEQEKVWKWYDQCTGGRRAFE